jgi:predicted MPP superfamily phosphohydrolase
MVKDPDFSKLKYYPGLTGNPFDRFIHWLDLIESIPTLIFVAILGCVAFLRFPSNWLYAMWLFSIYLFDWVLLLMLPITKRSFGPPKPPSLILAILRLPFTLFPQPWTFIMQLLGTLLVVYAFWIGPHRLKLTHQSLAIIGFKVKKPLRLLHLGDLHMERITSREVKILAMIEDLKPDLIVFSGDILNLSYIKDKDAWKAARLFFSNLHAPLGVFTVTGSPAVEIPEDYPELIRELPIHWLDDEITRIKVDDSSLEIIGLTCTHQPHLDFPRLQKLLINKKHIPRVLLYHSPDLAPSSSTLKIDLQLSGHTHGGQVRLPFFGALFTGCLHGKKFEAGRYQLRNMALYVTRGIGMEGAGAPRVRVLCSPEIVLWEISGK